MGRWFIILMMQKRRQKYSTRKYEIRRRLALLPYAAEIIEKSGKLVSRQERLAARPVHRHEKKVFMPANATFWKLADEIGNKKITVIIRQFQGGKKHFLSIYHAKNKNRPL